MKDQSKQFLAKYASVIFVLVSLFAACYGIYAGLANYSVMTSPLVNASPNLALVQSIFAGFFGAVVAFFVGGIFSVVLSVFAAVGLAVLFGGNKDDGNDGGGAPEQKGGKEDNGK
jgi:ABC-type phosphate transport system permease subunit